MSLLYIKIYIQDEKEYKRNINVNAQNFNIITAKDNKKDV